MSLITQYVEGLSLRPLSIAMSSPYNYNSQLNVDLCKAGSVTIAGDLFMHDLSHNIPVANIIKTMQDKINEMEKEMKIMRPIVNMQREKSARIIQQAWHNYLYAPGRGKYYKMAKKDFDKTKHCL